MVNTLPQYRSHLKSYSRDLRRNLTNVEMLLWAKLRRKQVAGHQFYRQKPLGPYIVDFYCPSMKLVIELDGGQHYLETEQHNDKVRDAYMRSKGLTVFRFSNRQILEEIDRVLESVYRYVTTTENLP